MAQLGKVTHEFITALSSPLSTDEEVNASLQECFKALGDSNEAEINSFMRSLVNVFNLPDVERGALAATVCGYLVERGFPSDTIVDDVIKFYEELLDNSRLFFEMFLSQVSLIEDDREDRDSLIDTLFKDLLTDTDIITPQIYNAVISLDKFYAAAISLFSINKNNFFTAKKRLGEKVAFAQQYNQGCYWINKLFGVLFDESVTVIDIDHHIGFEGKISGVVDNYQLQRLLMNQPLLNGGKSSITEEYFAVVSGNSEQQSMDVSIENKWNMYNIELCEQEGWKKLINTPTPEQFLEFQDTWIWSEGSPSEISKRAGKRIILLGAPSYSRSTKVQRTFRNLKASILVEKELSSLEIDKWLNK